MQHFVTFISIALLLLILGIFARNIRSRTWDILSWRNLFLLGFLHFYCLSAYFTATGTTLPNFIRLAEGAWGKLAAGMVLFIAVFLPAANWGMRSRRLTSLIPKLQVPVTSPAIVTCVLVLSGLALLFSIPFMNYFGVVVSQIRGNLAAAAVGLATYYLIARRFNPMSWVLLLTAIGVGAIASTVGASGRRAFLSVLLVIPWIWYFAVWRYQSSGANFGRIAVLFVLGVMAIVIYSPFRSPVVGKEATMATMSLRAQQFQEIITNPKLDGEAFRHILYTDTVPNTTWVLHHYPGTHGFWPLHGVQFVLSNPIPRGVWSGKPEAFGIILRDQMRVVPNLGPGIIAHGWMEGWFFGIVAYALFFGLLVGVVDRAVSDRSWNPFFLVVIGSNLGNVIALPRGDTPLFLLQLTAAFIACALVIGTLRIMFGPVWAAFPVLSPPGAAEETVDSESIEMIDEAGEHTADLEDEYGVERYSEPA